MKPLISIIIPVKNGKQTLVSCLKGIGKQTLYNQTEIIVIDSGSTDGTLELLQNFPEVKVYTIQPEDFNHGATRNYGVSLAKGEFIVMTVQDATADSKVWLETMIRHFDNPEVAGVCGQQIVPHEKVKNPHEWFRPQSNPKTISYQLKNSHYFQLTALEKQKICRWDDVNAMYRKSALEKTPFQSVMFGEDMLWAQDALISGYEIIYDPHAKVEHYHSVSYDFQYKRSFTVLYHRYKFFNYKSNYSIPYKEFLKTIYRNFKYKASLKWIPYNFIRLQAIKSANEDFQKFLSMGDDYLDQKHSEICQTAPLASIKEK